MSAVAIRSGWVIIYRLFDVAEEIDLARIGAGSSRLTMARGSRQIIVRDAPVSLALGPIAIRLGGRRVEADLHARAWRYGAVSLQFHVPLPPAMRWEELVELAALAEDDNDIDEIASARLRELQVSLASALRLPHAPATTEDYVVYFLQTIEGATPAELPAKVDIPALILGEPRIRLGEQIRKTIAAHTFSYSENDLAVIDWNSALVCEPGATHEVADVLEFALTHLLEFRYFDDILDQQLERLYDEVGRRRPSLWRRGLEDLSREANALYLEFADYVERVENSVKFVGDLTWLRSSARPSPDSTCASGKRPWAES